MNARDAMKVLEPGVDEAVWQRYGEEYPTPMNVATRDAVVWEFAVRGYRKLEDIERFFIALSWDGWPYANRDEHGQIINWARRTNKYMNVYITEQMYGGPEEGGWYYTVGDPLASVPVAMDATQEELDDLEKHIRRTMDLPEADERSDYQVCIELDFAQPFPKERPHYE